MRFYHFFSQSSDYHPSPNREIIMKTNKVMIKLAEVHCVAHEKNPIFEKNRFLKKMFSSWYPPGTKSNWFPQKMSAHTVQQFGQL